LFLLETVLQKTQQYPMWAVWLAIAFMLFIIGMSLWYIIM
jgi:hypothetical protein